MDALVTNYLTLTTAFLSVMQKLGLLTLPVGIGLTALINYFGGERALKAVGAGIVVLAILTLILENAAGIGTWIGHPSVVAATGAVAQATATP